MSRWRVAPLDADPSYVDGLVALFERTNSSCYCRYWHFAGDKNEWLARCAFEPTVSRDELVHAARTSSEQGRGVIAIDARDGTPEGKNRVIGWMKVAPAASLTKIAEQRYYRSLPTLRGSREGVFVVGCFLVDPEHRRESVSRALVLGAIDAVRAWGGVAIEAMPRVPAAPPVPDEELFTGPRAPFDEAGFRMVEGMDAYPVMRFDFE